MDFNPTSDRIRLVNDADISLRVNPVTGALAAQDTNLNPGNPNVTAVAYSNNFNGAASTTLYDIDTGSDVLAIQNPPNNGTLTTVGAGLGLDAGPATGFDIDSTGTAYAVLSTGGGNSGLYTIDLVSGTATLSRLDGGAARRPGRRLAGRGPGARGHAVARGDRGQRDDGDHLAQERRQHRDAGHRGRDRRRRDRHQPR